MVAGQSSTGLLNLSADLYESQVLLGSSRERGVGVVRGGQVTSPVRPCQGSFFVSTATPFRGASVLFVDHITFRSPKEISHIEQVFALIALAYYLLKLIVSTVPARTIQEIASHWIETP